MQGFHENGIVHYMNYHEFKNVFCQGNQSGPLSFRRRLYSSCNILLSASFIGTAISCCLQAS